MVHILKIEYMQNETKWNKNSKILFFLLIHVYCEAYIILFHIVILYTCKKKKIPFYHTIYFTVIWDFGGFIWRIKIKYLLECTKNLAKKIVSFVKQAFRKTLLIGSRVYLLQELSIMTFLNTGISPDTKKMKAILVT